MNWDALILTEKEEENSPGNQQYSDITQTSFDEGLLQDGELLCFQLNVHNNLFSTPN